jgi:flavin-dependent dehydrogenase
MRGDPLIIGGGPAGCAAAITLARAGHRPTILERTSGPADKVCGDFLSIDTIRSAQSLGVDPYRLGGAPIDRVRIIVGQRTAEAALPFPAIGLSRRVFDEALLRQAASTGAIVRTGQPVRRLTRVDAGWRTDTEIDAPAVFLATGKHDLRDAPRRHTSQDAVGMKMYLHLAPGPARTLSGATELTLFPGGYAGMQCVEAGRVVLCIAVRQSAFRAAGSGWTGLLRSISRHSRRFATMLEGATDLLPRPLAVAGIPYGYQATGGALFRIGDQAAVIPSLTGDGVAIALHSGGQAAEAWLHGVEPLAFQRDLARTLAPQMGLAGLLHNAGLTRAVQPAAIAMLRLFPDLLGYAARHTRVPPQAALA